MKFDDLWIIILEKNELLKNKTVTMSVENFKKAIKLAYDKGYEQDFDEPYIPPMVHQEDHHHHLEDYKDGDCPSDLFNTLFGGNKY